jgi:peptide subunit release factor 1 (eRF1)
VYVETTPARIPGQAYLVAYRDRCRALRPQLAKTQRATFDAAVKRIERYLVDQLAPHSPGLAVFDVGASASLLVVSLPKPPVEDVTWGNSAEITPLEAMLDDTERVAVLLFDAEHTRLLTIFLGAIETQQAFKDYVPGKQATGGWFALQQSNFARHREDHLRRHAQRTVRALMDLLRTRSFDRLLIGGPDEAIAVLQRELSRPLRARFAGKLDLELFAGDHDVLLAAVQAIETVERQEEVRMVDELLESASTPRVILGFAGVRAALARGRVHLLLLANDFADASLREAIVRQALEQDAKLEVVSGAAAARLQEHGGIGAWTRF